LRYCFDYKAEIDQRDAEESAMIENLQCPHTSAIKAKFNAVRGE